MPTRTVKARVEIDGEKEYKNALSELNRDNKVLAAEMSKLKAQFEGNAESVDFLRKKDELLSEQLTVQESKTMFARKALSLWQEKLEEVRKELGASTEEYKQAQAAVANWTAVLARSEAAEFELKNAIEENNRVLDYQQSEIKKAEDALSELNKGSQVLASEMSKLQAQYRDNADSTEALTAKGDLLERQLLQQKDKVQTLRDALARAATEYGEADERTQDWTIKLNNAEAAQYDLERAIKENNKALKNQGQEMVGLGDGIADLTGKLRIKLPDAAKKALNGMGEFSAGTAAKMGIAAAAVATVIKAMEQLQQITLDSAAKADEILTDSAVTGLSTRTIQALKYAEQFVDVSYSTISGSLTKLTKNMASARDSTDKVSDAFGKLGVSFTDATTGELRPAEQVFYDVIDALGAMENQTERDVLAMQLMGESAKELKYDGQFIDVSSSKFSGALTKLTKNMASARDSTDKVSDAFRKMGVSFTDATTGELRPAEQVFYDVIDALGAMENKTEQDALAMQLMGKSAQELSPLIQQGSQVLKDFNDVAEAGGYILDESQLEKLGEVDDAYQKLQLQIESTKDKLALDFAPASVNAMELFGKAVSAGSDILDRSGLLENLVLILSSLADIGGSVIDLIQNLPGLDTALSGLKVTLGAVAQLVALIADAADVVAGLVTWDFNRVGNALGFGYNRGEASNWRRVYMSQNGTLQEYQDFYNSPYYTGYTGNNASGNQNWRGGLTYLSENGAEAAVLPQGTRIYSAQDSRLMGGGDTYNFTVSVKDLEDLDRLIRWAKGTRVRERMK